MKFEISKMAIPFDIKTKKKFILLLVLMDSSSIRLKIELFKCFANLVIHVDVLYRICNLPRRIELCICDKGI